MKLLLQKIDRHVDIRLWPKWILSSKLFSKFRLCIVLFLGISSVSCEKKIKNPEQIFYAEFNLSGDGYNENIKYNSADNLIFSKLSGKDMWIRLAADKNSNGEDGPHIDIDICNYAGSGDYSPIDPQLRPCPAGLLWDIFWHDGDKVYSNQANSSPCKLTLKLDGDVISGTFNCSQVVRFEGSETIEITRGTFTSKIE